MTFQEIWNQVALPGAVAVVFDGDCYRPVERVERGWANFHEGKVVDWIQGVASSGSEGYVLAFRLIVQSEEPQNPAHPIPVLRGIAARVASGSATGRGS